MIFGIIVFMASLSAAAMLQSESASSLSDLSLGAGAGGMVGAAGDDWLEDAALSDVGVGVGAG